MDSICLKKQVLVFLVMSAFVMAQSMRLTRWQIVIKNELSKRQMLYFRCKSVDTKLMEISLKMGAQFKWNFKVNFWGTTEYMCYFRKPDLTEVTFDVFWVEKKTRWLRVKCDNNICNWIAKDDGIYLKDNSENTDERIHTWKVVGPNGIAV